MDKNSEIVNNRHWSEGLGMLLVDFQSANTKTKQMVTLFFFFFAYKNG